MCGIAVAVNWPDAEARVQDVIAGLAHRGLISDPLITAWAGAALATRRLPIVDPEGGRQPMVSADGRVLVAFNGEIYNHRDLRGELEALGVRFTTTSDTEVLANVISLWGSAGLRRLVGIYAFVALDLLKHDFLAARDPMGVKPLYLVQAGEAFLFSSEIRPLLNATDEGDVLLLPPGHILNRTGCYFLRPPAAEPRWGGSDEELDQRLSKAVELRLPPAAPVALMFSGGIDSTLVAHYARRARPDAPAYFLGSRSAPDYPFAAEYAELVGMELHQCETDLAPSAERIQNAVSMSESYEPDVVRNTFCTSVISERIRQDGFKVALSGEGADELFAGYPPLEIVFAADEAMGAHVRDQYLEAMHRSNLQRLDRGGMAHQLEIREPFLDPQIISYAKSLEGPALVLGVPGARQGKTPLRRLYDLHPAVLPRSIRNRRKVPMGEGSGLEPAADTGPWTLYADSAVSDAEFEDGKRRRRAFDLRTKEEYLYLEMLAATLDITRVPHLLVRHRILVPNLPELRSLGSGAWVL